MKRYCYLLALPFAAASLLAGCAAAGDRAAEIDRWQVLYSQEQSLDRVSGMEGWKHVTLPFMARLPYPPKRAIQYLWLKGEITLERPDDFAGISLGRVYLVDRVFVNGTLVGKHLPDDVQDLHYPRNYEIPPGVLAPGMNTVHVCLGIYGVEYGGLAGSVKLLSRDLFLKTSILMEFLYRQLTVGILLVFLAGIIFIVMELIWRGPVARYLIVLMTFIIWISYLMAIFSPYYPFTMDFRITLMWSCASLIPIFFFLYIQYYFRVFLSFWNMIYIPILVICAILTMVNQDTTSPYYLGRVLGLSAVGISIPAHGYLVFYIMRRNRPDIMMFYFFVLGVVPVSVIVWDIINAMFVFHYPPLYHIYALPAIVVLFMILRVNETMSRQVRLQVLYGRLKYEIGDVKAAGTAEPGSSSGVEGEAILTPPMEERLQKVVDFLKANYQSDIAADGMAMAMGLSRDRMNRVFRAFTGHRLGEYINRLRIEDAARQLRETDLRIAEIAFSVGFESVIVFNRAFLKIMDMTPTEYRKNQATTPAP
ncbi:MAG TPA: helix-turn-helix domain-containing protein [Spirochaetota bacterium]|nr:helix-turn-helix domain-containing protein [Spirochaetota bacterium]HPC41490.1 helix-turn-helix domain-containing protein [Spirochaetota bacterium]HPL15623.1 helix-turn-helix domain-containing protein [Spirochaetota bacterium]HQF09142.1 helix-turn-helix domain-containing protein [Spirochaetota bacterium]HQH97633.1 helix-turn-helix domain-containing protein [Spirochaetota bacterium]